MFTRNAFLLATILLKVVLTILRNNSFELVRVTCHEDLSLAGVIFFVCWQIRWVQSCVCVGKSGLLQSLWCACPDLSICDRGRLGDLAQCNVMRGTREGFMSELNEIIVGEIGSAAEAF